MDRPTVKKAHLLISTRRVNRTKLGLASIHMLCRGARCRLTPCERKKFATHFGRVENGAKLRRNLSIHSILQSFLYRPCGRSFRSFQSTFSFILLRHSSHEPKLSRKISSGKPHQVVCVIPISALKYVRSTNQTTTQYGFYLINSAPMCQAVLHSFKCTEEIFENSEYSPHDAIYGLFTLDSPT